MAKSNSNKAGKNIWSRITLDELTITIAGLGDRTDQLEAETWRLNDKTRSPGSLWGEIIDKLKLDNNETTRHSLYNIWNKKRQGIRKLVLNKKRSALNLNENDEDEGSVSVPEEKNSVLLPDPSLPLPQRPKTRAIQKENDNDNSNQSSVNNEISVVFTANEWKTVFSRTHQDMKDGWRDIFNTKLTSSGTGIKCTLKFKKPYIKEGERKKNCRFLGCWIKCIISGCKRTYHILLRNLSDENLSTVLLVRIYGEENHDSEIETAGRQLRGENRFRVGKIFHYLFRTFKNMKCIF